MATTVNDLLKSATRLRDNILDETEKIVYANENIIIRLQTEQIEQGRGNDGKPLRNRNPLFTGRYTLSTQLVSQEKNLLAPKIAGELYNFLATGAFLSSFEVEVDASKTKVIIINTGTGSGQKADFFQGYGDKLLSLDDENSERLNFDIILPKLQEFVQRTL